jgi:hypothetical protein
MKANPTAVIVLSLGVVLTGHSQSTSGNRGNQAPQQLQDALKQFEDAKSQYEAAKKAYEQYGSLDYGLNKTRNQCFGILSDGLQEQTIAGSGGDDEWYVVKIGRDRFLNALSKALGNRWRVWDTFEKAVTNLTKTEEDAVITEGFKRTIVEQGKTNAKYILTSGVENFYHDFLKQLSNAGGPYETRAIAQANSTIIAAIEKNNIESEARKEGSLFITADDFQEISKYKAVENDVRSSETEHAMAGISSSEVAMKIQRKIIDDTAQFLKSYDQIKQETKEEAENIIGRETLKRMASQTEHLKALTEATKNLEKAKENLDKANRQK